MGIMDRIRATITPWWNCGCHSVWRLDSLTEDFEKESLGEVRRFEIQWLGVHFAIELGRTPRTMTDAEEAELRTRIAAFKAKYRQEASL